jgi:hypothetical protein
MFVMMADLEASRAEIKVPNPHGEERGTHVSNHVGPAAAAGRSSFETLASQAPQDEVR